MRVYIDKLQFVATFAMTMNKCTVTVPTLGTCVRDVFQSDSIAQVSAPASQSHVRTCSHSYICT